jgi:hypothetical protein
MIIPKSSEMIGPPMKMARTLILARSSGDLSGQGRKRQARIAWQNDFAAAC